MVKIKRMVSGLLVRVKLVDGTLMENKVKSIKADRIEIKAYEYGIFKWALYKMATSLCLIILWDGHYILLGSAFLPGTIGQGI